MLSSYIQAKGYAYEQFVHDQIKISNDFDDVWFFKSTPENIIAKTSLYDSYETYSKYRNSDIGADLVAVRNNKVFFIQCKNYDQTISINDLASYYFLLHEHNLNGVVYYNGKLSERITDLSKQKVPFINLQFNNQLIDNLILKQKQPNNLSPKDYQTEAVECLQNHERAILSLPCGMGKTFTSSLIATSYPNVVILAPTRTLAEELLFNMYEYLDELYTPILISMDGSRNIEHIKSIITEMNIISATYDSVDILVQIIDNLICPFVIIDEYHNLSEANLTDKTNPINKLLQSNHKILFMSATPLKTNLSEITNAKYFGNQIYKYPWTTAIEKSYICDFKIVLPENCIYVKIFEQFMIDLNSDIIDHKLVYKAYFLLRAMLYEGSKKCIVYLTSIEKANQFEQIVDWMKKLLNVEIFTYQINCHTTKTKRAEYLQNFINCTNISLIFNVQILNEGINIPETDSVYITSPSNNIINLVQRMCRANRILPNKKSCNIYMWCTETKTNQILSYINDQTYGELTNRIFKLNINDQCQITNMTRHKINSLNPSIFICVRGGNP
jgi:superfamily II DNA or RNA helicase